IPFLKRILVVFFLPFRWIHVYLHIYAAKEILKEIQDLKDQGIKDPLLDNGNLRASLISGVDVPDENPGLLMSFSRFEYAKRIAFAPNKLAFSMLLGYFLVTPLVLADTNVISSQVGALIHLYLFVGIFGVLMPSINDWYFMIHALMINMQVRPIWFYNSILVYLAFTFDTILRTSNFFLSILFGTLWFVIYVIGLFIVGYVAKGGKIRKPIILWLPVEKQTLPVEQKVGVEFLSLEDIDL
ncbi:MAG: hypothetical protein KAT16_10795, partial [Candidatus Heimdallarchaeota archaeon]|nr:hypothetical protein [Candidatus Heimdallarchaeota archaeon]